MEATAPARFTLVKQKRKARPAAAEKKEGSLFTSEIFQVVPERSRITNFLSN